MAALAFWLVWRIRHGGRLSRIHTLRKARRDPHGFARLMHGAVSHHLALFVSPMPPEFARRALRGCSADQRIAVGVRFAADCWACGEILSDRDPGDIPHGRIEDVATARLRGLVEEGAKR